MIDYKNMIDFVQSKAVERILVFGPPRSGTTISAYILHKETGLELIPEETGNHLSRQTILNMFELPKKFVLHANNAIHYFHEIKDKNSCIVMVRRTESAVLKSAIKKNKLDELNRAYGPLGGNNYVDGFLRTWEHRAPKNSNFMLLDYESLQDSPYWIAPELRTNFELKQISLEYPYHLLEFGDEFKQKHTTHLPPGDKRMIKRWSDDDSQKKPN